MILPQLDIIYYDQRRSPGTLKILALQKWYFGVALFHSSHFTPKPDFLLNIFINKNMSNFAENLCAVRSPRVLTAHIFSAKSDNFLLMELLKRKYCRKKYKILIECQNDVIPRQICVNANLTLFKRARCPPLLIFVQK